MGGLLELTQRAEATHFWFRGFRMYFRPAVAAIAAGRRDLRLLDCGCGTGHNMTTLLMPHGRTFGFDLFQDGIDRARATGRPLARADAQRIPFASGTFDVAASFDVMQSVPDDRAMIVEMARVLKPGGHVVLNVTALEFMRGDHSMVWGELRRYTPARITQLLECAGLQPVRISFLFGSVLPLMLAVRLLQKLMRTVREPSGDSDLTVPAAPINGALTAVLAVESWLARFVRIPFGSSLMVIAQKP